MKLKHEKARIGYFNKGKVVRASINEYSACTSGRLGRFYVGNWHQYAENPKIRHTLTSP